LADTKLYLGTESTSSHIKLARVEKRRKICAEDIVYPHMELS
jgi:hypothetical protein